MRVRWSEADPQGVVFNAHYLTYADVALTEYWRAVSAHAGEDLGAFSHQLFVVDAHLQYRRPLRNDDAFVAACRAERLGNTSLTFRFAFFTGETCVHTSAVVYAWVPQGAERAAPLPEPVRRALGAFEKVPPQLGRPA